MNQYLLYIWVGVMVISASVEVVQYRLIAIWFALGALMSALISLFGFPLWAQILVFVLVPAVAIPLLRPILKRKLEEKMRKREEEGQKLIKEENMSEQEKAEKIKEEKKSEIIQEEQVK